MKALMIILGAIATIAASASALAFVGLPYQPLGVEFLQNNPYAPMSITAQAAGEEEPNQVSDADFGDVLQNGDFRILQISDSGTLGDGVEELTLWDFDFTTDPAFESFPTSTPLESAELTLTLTPMSADFSSDFISMDALDDVGPEEYDDLPQDEASTVEIDLLDFYSSEQILEVLTSHDGRITMVAGDDAIISSAELVLASEVASNGTSQ